MRSSKGSHKITVHGTQYRWRATGNDGYINVGIWPTNNIGPFILGNFCYHETWIVNDNGNQSSSQNQIVITNRIVKRIIEYAITKHNYEPTIRGTELNLKNLDEVIHWQDAVRASKKQPHTSGTKT